MVDYPIVFIGLAALLQGLPKLLNPRYERERLKREQKLDDSTIRLSGLLATGIALGILYIAL
jgi:uncharacterized protein YjeT (DUF2065 family)